jgi:hypothetical protein
VLRGGHLREGGAATTPHPALVCSCVQGMPAFDAMFHRDSIMTAGGSTSVENGRAALARPRRPGSGGERSPPCRGRRSRAAAVQHPIQTQPLPCSSPPRVRARLRHGRRCPLGRPSRWRCRMPRTNLCRVGPTRRPSSWASNRNFQSKGWAKSHNLDPPCVKSPSGALRHGERHRCPPPAPPASTSPAPPARPPPSPPPAPAAPRRAPVTTSYVDAAVRLRWQVSDESGDQAAPVTGETHDAHSHMHGNLHSRKMRLSW